MKRMLSLVAALALTLLTVPAMAADTPSIGETQETFYALSKLPTAESTAPTQMTDDQLAAIEGGQVSNVCVICANVGANAPIISPNTNNNNNQSNNPR